MTTLIDLGKLRFSFSGDWSSSTTYETNDIVKYGGNVYVYTYGLKTSGHLPTETDFWALMVEGIKFKGAYATGTAYKVGDGVAHGGKVYIAIKDTTGNTPPNVTYWSQFADGIQYEGAYSGTAQYQRNDVVQYGASAYIAKQDTTGNLPTVTAFWDKLVDGISATGVWSSVTAYVPGDLVAYGANIYKAVANNTNQLPIDSTGTLNSANWQLFNSGIRSRGDWTTATEYYINDVVTRGGSTYICVVRNASTTFEADLAANKWQKFNSGIRWRGAWATGTAYLRDDVVKNSVGTAYIANSDHTAGADFTTDQTAGKWTAMVIGGADVLPVIQSGDNGQSLTVKADGSGIDWIGATASDKVFWVAPHGTDAATSGKNQSHPFASIKYACQQAPTGSTIFVKTGTYTEQLPIVVPANVAIVGDSQRTVIVQPAAGLSDDGTTPNNQSTMFQMSNGSILNKMTFTGMTGWVPGTTAANVTTSTIKGVVVGFNPASPITHKSPYVLECAAICSGAIGALIDGTVHATGAKTMIFHGYTVINDNGIGYWVKDGGKAEIVSCFTYYCYFGYTASGGGFIRALNGNNSYGTWGATSRGFDANETPVTGALLGQQLNFLYGGGNINVGDTVTSATGSATVTNVQTTANKVYVQNATGTFTSGQALTFTSGGTGTVANGALENQKGFVLVLNNLTAMPKPGQSIQLTGDQYAYVVQSTTGTYTNTSSIITVVLAQEKPTGSASGTVATLRSKYSQIRLTGHDFLSIGTGGVTTTNYPGEPTQPAAQGNETDEAFPGRVFYVSTDQDGNFRVGEYFRIDQATGRATLNASAFDLAGLTSLRLGSIGAQLGETINEFSSDATLSGNSNTAVPTEYAVKTYVDNSGPLKAAATVSLTSANYNATYDSTLLNVTSAVDYRSIILPSALSANLITAKFEIFNRSGFVIAVRDNSGQLIASIQSGGAALAVLTDNTTTAGQWAISGTSLQPFFIANQVVVPNASGTTADNNPSTNPIFAVAMTSSVYLNVHLNAAGTISAYAVDYSTVPATVSTTPLVYASGSNYTVISVQRVSNTRALVFTQTDVILLNLSGTVVTAVTQVNSAYTSPVRNGYTTGSLTAVLKFDDELYGVMFGGAAAASPVFTVVKADGDTIRTGSYTLPNTNAVVNGWDAIVTSPTTALMVYGDSATTANVAPWAVRFARLTVTKGGSGTNPSATQSSTVLTPTNIASAAAYSIFISRDEAAPDTVCAIVGNNTTATINAYIATGAVTGSLALGTVFTIDTAATLFVASSFGQTPLTKALRNTGANAWTFTYQGANNFMRVAKITASGTTGSVTVPTYHGKNPASNIFTLGPSNASGVVFMTTHGQPTTSYSGVYSFVESSGTFQFREFVPPAEGILHTTVRTYVNWTSDGWVLATGALTTTATAVLQQHNQFAVYKVNTSGSITYYGTYGLPINTNIGVPFNPQMAEAGRVRDSFSSTFYDVVHNIPYRIALEIEYIKV